MNKHVVGFRTDVRSPYGNLRDKTRGAHFFPVHRCSVFISHDMPCKTPKEAKYQMRVLADRIAANSHFQPTKPDKLPPKLQKVIDAAYLLFEGIDDIHSLESLEEIARRYQRHREKMLALSPVIG